MQKRLLTRAERFFDVLFGTNDSYRPGYTGEFRSLCFSNNVRMRLYLTSYRSARVHTMYPAAISLQSNNGSQLLQAIERWFSASARGTQGVCVHDIEKCLEIHIETIATGGVNASTESLVPEFNEIVSMSWKGPMRFPASPLFRGWYVYSVWGSGCMLSCMDRGSQIKRATESNTRKRSGMPRQPWYWRVYLSLRYST